MSRIRIYFSNSEPMLKFKTIREISLNGTGGLLSVLIPCFFLFINFANAQTNSSTPVMTANPSAFNVEKELGFMSMDGMPEKEPALTSEQKSLLKAGLDWVNQNLKCIQEEDFPTKWSTMPDGKCFEVWNVCFGDFGTLGLVLNVSGSSQLAAHGAMLADEHYVFCSFDKGTLAAKVFWKNGGGTGLQLLKFPQGPDLIWTGDRVNEMTDEDPAQGHLFYRGTEGSLKEVLTYHDAEREVGVEHPDDFETRLIPEKGRAVRLLQMRARWQSDNDGNGGPVTQVTETKYNWDTSAGIYIANGATKNLSEKTWHEKKEPGEIDQ